MTRITFYKLVLGLSALSIITLVLVANMMMNSHRSQQRYFTDLKTVEYESPARTLKSINRLNSFNYLITLDSKEQRLKRKLILRYRLSEQKAAQYTKVINRVSEQFSVPSDLLAALIKTESNYISKAVSHKNAIGPAQIIAKYWKKVCSGDLFNIDNNIQCAAIILNRYKQRCKNDWDCALVMYNVGPGNYYKKSSYYQQAGQRYLAKINRNLKRLNS
jgi:soluble lytic murein transglycosylase-like protein